MHEKIRVLQRFSHVFSESNILRCNLPFFSLYDHHRGMDPASNVLSEHRTGNWAMTIECYDQTATRTLWARRRATEEHQQENLT